jgi:RHS repeat-associated protein
MNQSDMNNRGVAAVAGELRVAKRILASLLAATWMAGASAANVAPTVSMTAPLSEASFVAPTSVTLSASAADTDGTIASVGFYDGATLLGTVTTPPYNYNWNNVAAGTYSVTSKATDNAGAIAMSAPLTVTVKANVLPSVSLTSPVANAIFVGPATIAMAARASDTDGTIKRVDYYRDATLIGSATVAPYAYNWTNVVPGTYSVTAKATDDKWGVNTSTPVSVVVKANIAPTVAMTAPANGSTLYIPGTVTLTANAADSDGYISKVEFLNGATLIGTDTSAPFSYAWTNAAAGNYSLTARATDSKGAVTTSAAVALLVKAAPVPVVSITSPQTNARFIAPAAFVVTASASMTGDTISKVEFLSAGTLIGTATAAPFAISLTNVAAGSYNVSVKATGALGGSATSAPVDLVVAANAAPVINLDASPSSATAPAVITMNATATDADGAVAMVEFFNNTTLLATITQPPYTYTWSGLSAGTYVITARATDDRNVAAASNSVTLTVTAPSVDATEIFFIEGDQINTAREITDEFGALVWAADADAFGVNLPDENPAGKGAFTYNQRFPGQYFDKETGLHYNYYRDFDPQTGRYVQSDPIGLEGGINTYAYVSSNPLSEIDPLGLFGWRDAAGFVPVLGSGLDAYDAYKCGNYVRAGVNLGLALADATGAGALIKGLTVGTMRWSARQAIREAHANTSSWNSMRQALQRINEIPTNSRGTDRRFWLTTDHVFIKQIAGRPHSITNHPANLQINVTQSLNSRFEYMGHLERALYLPTWMKLSAGAPFSYGLGLLVGPGEGCDCNGVD